MNDYDIYPIDVAPAVSEFYKDVDDEYKISQLDISYFSTVVNKGKINPDTGEPIYEERCPLLRVAWTILVDNFELYYATREIGGETEYDFFNMMQSCLNRNADTYETQLEFYYQEVNKPVIGRTETIKYDVTDKREQDLASVNKYGQSVEDRESGSDMMHHVEVPADAPEHDTDRSRDKTDFGKNVLTKNGGHDTNVSALDDENKRTGTQVTELSSLGIKPNVEYMNEFLDTNKTFIQFFIESFEECFAPRYKRVYF